MTKQSISYFIIFILIALLLLKNCNKYNKTIDYIQEYYTDTIVVYKSHIDTILFYDTLITSKIIIDTIKYHIPNTKRFLFDSEIEDSLLSGNIETILEKDSYDNLFLISQNLKYKPKFPKLITKTDSVFTTIKDSVVITKTIHKDNFGLLVGTSINSNFIDQTGLYLKGGIHFKNNNILYGYDFFNKSHQISFIKQLNFYGKQ